VPALDISGRSVETMAWSPENFVSEQDCARSSNRHQKKLSDQNCRLIREIYREPRRPVQKVESKILKLRHTASLFVNPPATRSPRSLKVASSPIKFHLDDHKDNLANIQSPRNTLLTGRKFSFAVNIEAMCNSFPSLRFKRQPLLPM
jgi:hypothetical protein